MTDGCFSDWKPVSNGIPEGSVLCPQLLIIYINDIEDYVGSRVSKFVNDARLAGWLTV